MTLNGVVAIILLYFTVFDSCAGSGCATCWAHGLWPVNFPCPALHLQLTGDHLRG